MKLTKIFAAFIILMLAVNVSAQSSSVNPITEDLEEYMSLQPGNEFIRVNIRLSEKIEALNLIPNYASLSRNVVREERSSIYG